jgi:hypothetical protein
MKRLKSAFLAYFFFLAGGAVFPFSLQEGSKAVFDTRGRVLAEGRIFSFACRDFDGDGRLDIVVSDFLHPARLLFGDAALAFGKSVALTSTPETSTTGHGVAPADFNGDGRTDLFLVYNGHPGRVLFGDGRGGFADSGRPIGPDAYNGTSARAADFDGDGDVDVLVTYYLHEARLYLNDGTGLLTDSGRTLPASLEVGDVDGDGDLDALTLGEDGTVSFWLNDKGRFIRGDRTLAAGPGVFRLCRADFDADGDIDLVGLRREGPGVLLENNGRAGFRKLPQELSPGVRLAVGDIDRDGRPDLVIDSAVWLNKGGGAFELVQTVGPGEAASLELVDLDGDGDLDLLRAPLERDTGRADLRLFLNTLPRKVPGANRSANE